MGSRDERTLPAIRSVARRQWGVVHRDQILAAGASASTLSRWCRRGFLEQLLPRVYAFEAGGEEPERRIAAAVLFGGTNTVTLGHAAATFWWGFTKAAPQEIDLVVASHRRSRPGVRFHRRPGHQRVFWRTLPVLTVPATLVSFASVAPYPRLRRALAEADRLGRLNPAALIAELRRGRPGSAAAREALSEHLPELAETLSELEERFLALVTAAGLPTPRVNATVGGMMVDALYPEARLVVEVDGQRYHRGPISAEEDRRRELRLRRLGYRVVRYTWRQIVHERRAVLADLRAQLAS